MSSPQSKQQIKLNQLNSILSTNNSNSSNKVETTISKEVNLWKIRELAIADGGLLNGTFLIILYIVCVLYLCYCCRGSFGICCVFI